MSPQASPRKESHAFSRNLQIVPTLCCLAILVPAKAICFGRQPRPKTRDFIKARAFLVTPPHQLSEQSLFIDGLDERRAGRGDRDTVDAIFEKLFAVNPPRVRISCRAADWLGESDLAALRPYFEQSGDPPVLLLQSLSEQEQIAVLVGGRH